jgi:hypothetical protein
MSVIVLAGTLIIVLLLVVGLACLLVPEFPFLIWLALIRRERRPATKHPRVKSQRVGA